MVCLYIDKNPKNPKVIVSCSGKRKKVHFGT